MSAGKNRRAWQGERVLVLSPTPTHPQDFGNRKRIFRVCTHLKDQGAELTFVHYPAEAEWRHADPWSSEREMMRAWDRYFTIAPTRPLHPHPLGAHHEIDEWWDPAIGDFLRWLFSVQQFDVFIVNYAWMSRAFEHAPASVVRILDTHDRKSGRKEMLTANGIAPEYFFTTDDEEAIALGRADLIWAIKDEEREHFARLSATPVLTLPHLDPGARIARPAPDADGYFRVGFLAARNSINHVNLMRFLAAAEPVFREALAPIKLVIAGSICDLFSHSDSPFVELRGRVADAAAFYAGVDCAMVPMTFSTGLKIKTGEALSAGLPVVSTAHAFEGFEPADKFHTLPDFTAMAEALVELSFAPRARLDELAAASERSYAATARRIDGTFAATRAFVRERARSVAIAVDSRALVHGSIFNLVLRSTHDYLRRLGSVTVVAVKGSAQDIVENRATVDEFGRVAVAADLAGAKERREALAGMHVDTVDVAAWLAERAVKVVIADALHPGLAAAPSAAFYRAEMIALAQGLADFSLPAGGAERSFVVAPRPSRSLAQTLAASGTEMLLAPCFSRTGDLSNRLQPAPEPHVVILGSLKAEATALAAALAKSWRMRATVVVPVGETPAAGDAAAIGAAAYIDALVRGKTAAPTLALDLSAGAAGLQLAQEILERLRVRVVSAGGVGVHPVLGGAPSPAFIATEAELFELFRTLAAAPERTAHPVWVQVQRNVDSDRGWSFVRDFCERLFASPNAALA